MKKALLISLVIVLGLLFSGGLFISEFMSADSDSSTNNAETGTIVSMEKDSILIIKNAAEEDIDNATSDELVQKYNDGAWFDVSEVENNAELETGMQVKVWFRSLNTSLPAYGEAVKLQIL